MMISLFVVTVLLAMGTASPVADVRIVGGTSAVEGQFPYQVSLRSFGIHLCGGSIISDRWVLTVTQCTLYENPVNVQVWVGTVNITGGEEYAVEKIINHESYDSATIRNDIALLKTATKIQFSDLVKPVPIRWSHVNSDVDAVVSGWGMLSYYEDLPDTLKFVFLKTITNDKCKKMLSTVPPNWYFSKWINAGSLCAFTKTSEDLCYGDNGGPLVVKGELVGIVSWGINCAVGYPNVFTRVSEFSSWVQDKLDKN